MSESNFKNNYRERLKKRTEEAGTVRKIVAIILTALILVLIIGGLSGYFYIKSALEPVDPGDDSAKNIEIPLGSSTSQIASILEQNEIIKNDLVFRFYTKFNNESGFQAGNYQFTQSMTLDEIIESLKSGKLVKAPAFKVTVPEGKTLEQIAEIYAEETEFTKEEFMEKVNDEKYVKKLIEKYPELLNEEEILAEDVRYPLEGYLFAATYPFYIDNPSIEQIVDMMVKKTDEVVRPYKDDLLKQKNIETVHDAVTMASLLENEARTKEDRKKIARVFYNRFEEGMPLQTDPTVLYALGKHKEKVLYKDLEVESPYNTYYVEGLPVGPISNFNKNALVAAANPAGDENNLYFLADSEGNIYYAETLKEHNKLKEKHIE
ncbi:endolytic transglycosylase MltG [Halobacillus yeomjeoni]|uniref:Endolytic murein transglycosylase n=1 Tax=Halobacillus yeomjeoni TaxID=311194 RepID=A0A931MUN9_9BACI|nr:endolytic transglycosylase MltG [Halobacillus yeomjeoni]MBH0229962.1 endolytic transglycosylase MltG [Halobacillus yeomjeoni]